VEAWFDCGTQEALLLTNQHLLRGAPLPAHAQDTVVIPPVHIDPSARVERSVLGPHVSIGAGAQVRDAVVRNTIVGEQAVVENILIEDSLIGFQAVVRGQASRLNVGDMSEITN
jgi:glucose-1-phosphate thymidylyltransferase